MTTSSTCKPFRLVILRCLHSSSCCQKPNGGRRPRDHNLWRFCGKTVSNPVNQGLTNNLRYLCGEASSSSLILISCLTHISKREGSLFLRLLSTLLVEFRASRAQNVPIGRMSTGYAFVYPVYPVHPVWFWPVRVGIQEKECRGFANAARASLLQLAASLTRQGRNQTLSSSTLNPES